MARSSPTRAPARSEHRPFEGRAPRQGAWSRRSGTAAAVVVPGPARDVAGPADRKRPARDSIGRTLMPQRDC